MIKYIKLTPALIKKAKTDFVKSISEQKSFTGDINYRVPLDASDSYSKAVLTFTQAAYAKMCTIVSMFSSEIGWHGTAKRTGKNTFIITDIFVYPQVATAATVNTDQKKYQDWLMELPDQKFNNLRMHGHSHVNMGVIPSSVDIQHREGILDNLNSDMFYIFMVWNKSLAHDITIFDFKNNVMYTDASVNVIISELDINGFLKVAHQNVSTYQTTTMSDPTHNFNKVGMRDIDTINTQKNTVSTINKKIESSKTPAPEHTKEEINDYYMSLMNNFTNDEFNDIEYYRSMSR